MIRLSHSLLMQIRRFIGLVDLGILAVVVVALVLPDREMFASSALKGDDSKQFALALAEARTIAAPEDGRAVEAFCSASRRCQVQGLGDRRSGGWKRTHERFGHAMAGAVGRKRRVCRSIGGHPRARLCQPRALRMSIDGGIRRRDVVPSMGRGATAFVSTASRRRCDVRNRSASGSERLPSGRGVFDASDPAQSASSRATERFRAKTTA